MKSMLLHSLSGMAIAAVALYWAVPVTAQDFEITWSTIDSGGLTLQVKSSGITSDMILFQTIQFSDIGANGCAVGEVMKWAASTWVCLPDLKKPILKSGGPSDSEVTVTAMTPATTEIDSFTLDAGEWAVWVDLQLRFADTYVDTTLKNAFATCSLTTDSHGQIATGFFSHSAAVALVNRSATHTLFGSTTLGSGGDTLRVVCSKWGDAEATIWALVRSKMALEVDEVGPGL